ncbi:MAG: imidazolonepropionase [Clostridiales bacterium]|nr:imidazolonepropionase [Clostridiales bacterium]
MNDQRICAVINIGILATPKGLKAKAGTQQGEILSLKNAYLLIEDGFIKELGTGTPDLTGIKADQILDAGGRLVTPGLVDAHTHLVFGGWRAHELQQKLAGVPYLDILAAGGGILNTVGQTRKATENELFNKAAKALDGMIALGTTTVEAKSGYGLDLENELKQLRVAKQLDERHLVDVVSTLMVAHAVPSEYKHNRNAFLDLILNTIIPAVAQENLAAFCDVFCETGVFDVAESKAILLCAQAHGMRSKIHADEIDAIGGSELAGELKAISAEHLIALQDSGIASLKTGGTIACLLPATSFYLGKPYARAQNLIAAGVPVAIASDFNPGSCPSYSLQFCMNLAAYNYRMSSEQVLTSVTLNAAAAIDKAKIIGSLEAGKLADLVIWDAETLDFLFYRFGSNLVKSVVKRGILV